MRVKTVKTNDCTVIVDPRYAGNYGSIRIGGVSRTSEGEYGLCEEIVNNIKRHIDDVEQAYIKQKVKYLSEDGIEEFDTIEEVLISMFAPDDYKPSYWFVKGKASDNENYFTATTVYSFNELVKCAYDYPYDFYISSGNITENEKIIIDRILEFRKRP